VDRAPWFALPERRGDMVRFMLYLTVTVAGVYVALSFAWQIREALLLAFASVVGAVLLLSAAEPIERRTSLSRNWSLVVVAVLLLLLLSGFLWLVGTQLRAQISDLTGKLPAAIDSIQQTLGISLPIQSGQSGDGGIGLSGIASGVQDLFGSLVSLGSTVATGLSSLVLVIVGAFFLAAAPSLYRGGLVKLFPKDQHARVDDALITSGRALRLWLLAQLISMAAVGLLIFLGTWLIGLSAPLALGLFASVTEFIPVIGPILGAVPAVLLALTQGGWTALWTVVLFVVVQQIESNLIMPLVQRRLIEIPPALLLFALLAIGLLFGTIGVVIATPLTVVIYVLVKKLYVREILGEETQVPGEG
jgi:predicted PurR-regulated permease PerM